MAYASPAAHTHKTAARFAGGVRASSSSSLLYSAYFKPFIVDNFTSSFSDGVVLCLIINYYYPHLLPLQQIAFPNDPLAIASDVPPTPAAQRHDPRAGAWAGSIDYNALTVTESPLARHKRLVIARNFALLYRALRALGGDVPALLHPECADSALAAPLDAAGRCAAVAAFVTANTGDDNGQFPPLNEPASFLTPARASRNGHGNGVYSSDYSSTPMAARSPFAQCKSPSSLRSLAAMATVPAPNVIDDEAALVAVRDTTAPPPERVVILFVARLFSRMRHASDAIHAARTLQRAWRARALRRALGDRVARLLDWEATLAPEQRQHNARLRALQAQRVWRNAVEKDRESRDRARRSMLQDVNAQAAAVNNRAMNNAGVSSHLDIHVTQPCNNAAEEEPATEALEGEDAAAAEAAISAAEAAVAASSSEEAAREAAITARVLAAEARAAAEAAARTDAARAAHAARLEEQEARAAAAEAKLEREAAARRSAEADLAAARDALALRCAAAAKEAREHGAASVIQRGVRAMLARRRAKRARVARAIAAQEREQQRIARAQATFASPNATDASVWGGSRSAMRAAATAAAAESGDGAAAVAFVAAQRAHGVQSQPKPIAFDMSGVASDSDTDENLLFSPRSRSHTADAAESPAPVARTATLAAPRSAAKSAALHSALRASATPRKLPSPPRPSALELELAAERLEAERAEERAAAARSEQQLRLQRLREEAAASAAAEAAAEAKAVAAARAVAAERAALAAVRNSAAVVVQRWFRAVIARRTGRRMRASILAQRARVAALNKDREDAEAALAAERAALERRRAAAAAAAARDAAAREQAEEEAAARRAAEAAEAAARRHAAAAEAERRRLVEEAARLVEEEEERRAAAAANAVRAERTRAAAKAAAEKEAREAAAAAAAAATRARAAAALRARREAAAVVLQSAWRGRCVRRSLAHVAATAATASRYAHSAGYDEKRSVWACVSEVASRLRIASAAVRANPALRLCARFAALGQALRTARDLPTVTATVRALARLGALVPVTVGRFLLDEGLLRLLLKLVSKCGRDAAQTLLLRHCLALLTALAECGAVGRAAFEATVGTSADAGAVLCDVMQLFRDRPVVFLAASALLTRACHAAPALRISLSASNSPAASNAQASMSDSRRRLALIESIFQQKLSVSRTLTRYVDARRAAGASTGVTVAAVCAKGEAPDAYYALEPTTLRSMIAATQRLQMTLASVVGR